VVSRTKRTVVSRQFGWLLLCAILLAVFLSACSGRPQITVAATELDLGDVVNGTVLERELIIHNNGQADLVVDAVTTSCGCTQATIEPMTIAPDDSGTLHIVFDSGAHGPGVTGQLVRQVFIATNDPQRPETVIELVANILPPASE
jgi:hypothetical protein